VFLKWQQTLNKIFENVIIVLSIKSTIATHSKKANELYAEKTKYNGSAKHA